MTRRRLTIAAALLAAAVAFLAWLRLGPVPAIDEARFTSTSIVDRNGVVLSEPLSSRGQRSEWLRADALPASVTDATIAAEDRRFFAHLGVDPRSVVRAAWHTLRRGRVVEGGSTITQQVAKLLLDSQSRALSQKVREAVIALRLEHRYSKRELLALYLNLAPYGNQTTGIVRASRRYFGVAPEELTLAQAAFLASLPQRPGAFNPLRDPKAAEARQRWVLSRMAITKAQRDEALHERLRFDHGQQALAAPHFVERVRERAPHAGVIRTTLDAQLQREVQGIIAAERASLLAHGARAAAVAVLDNRSGEWLAWEGSGDYFGNRFGGAIDGVSALRQPGSTLKPFTYAVAFEQGFSPASVLADVPSSFPTAEQGIVYTPRNYDGRYRGPLRARLALAGSENVPAVALLAKVGVPSLLRLLRNAGFTDLTRTAGYYGLGLTLGDPEVRLEQLVGAYSMLARGGVYVEPRMLADERPSVPRRMLAPRTAFWITDILSDAAAREYIFGSGGNLEFPFPVAVKTGTSQAYRDNWTIGYTRDVTVGVWVGNFDRQELRNSTGVTGAGPIFHQVLLAAVKRVHGEQASAFEPPPDVERVPVCALSGLRPSTSCPNVTTEWARSEAPVEFCSWHRRDSVDWPAEYRAWATVLDGGHPSAPAAPRTRLATVRVTSPPNGATYLIDPTLRMPYQALRLRAAADTPVTWQVNGRPVASEWLLQPGHHTITATDGRGRRDTVEITVK
ncbi:MAG: family penicillin-binding protein [Acidobacteria bacterium]|nr:family penicillin-binding protein [Acidobacteriota bacterium]